MKGFQRSVVDIPRFPFDPDQAMQLTQAPNRVILCNNQSFQSKLKSDKSCHGLRWYKPRKEIDLDVSMTLQSRH